MTCTICHRPKRREYVTALLMAHAGKQFSAAAIASFCAAADCTPADFAADLAALPALLTDHPIGAWPAPVGLGAARDHLLESRTCR